MSGSDTGLYSQIMFRYVSDFPQHPQEWVKKTYILNKEDYRKGVDLVQHE